FSAHWNSDSHPRTHARLRRSRDREARANIAGCGGRQKTAGHKPLTVEYRPLTMHYSPQPTAFGPTPNWKFHIEHIYWLQVLHSPTHTCPRPNRDRAEAIARARTNGQRACHVPASARKQRYVRDA